MNRINVRSTDLASVGYDPESQILEVEFKNKRSVYHYYNVPQSVYEGLMSASSKGRYLHRQIKGRFRYKKIR